MYKVGDRVGYKDDLDVWSGTIHAVGYFGAGAELHVLRDDMVTGGGVDGSWLIPDDMVFPIGASSMETAPSYPDDNPKTSIGATKVPLHLVPPSAKHYLALAFKDGAAKYGPYNWREKKVSMSVYYAAAMRHMDALWDGEDLSEDAKVHHAAHAMACMAIIVDAMSIGMLNDDRPFKGAVPRLQKEYADAC